MVSFTQLVLVFFLLLLPGFRGGETEFRVISFGEFEQMVGEESEKLRIYNFWATWCAPCVREMPFFEEAAKANPHLELVFISMDDGRDPGRVTDFIQKRNISSPVFLLNDVDFNKWIDRVDPSWSGAIPATLFVRPDGKQHFHEGELNDEELQTLIQTLNQNKP